MNEETEPVLGANCSSACPTKDHATFGECMRSKNVRTLYANSASGLDYTREKNWEKNLQNYRDARAQGIQPDSTSPRSIQRAVAASDKTGKAYGS